MKLLSHLCITLSFFASITNFASARDLDVAGEKVKKDEVRYSQIGPRESTLIFYTFTDQAAVLQLSVSRKNRKFSIGGKINLFPEGTDAKVLEKWVNNQHSCGIFPGVPSPTTTVVLPTKVCTVLDSKLKADAKETTSPMGEKFQDYTIKIKVSDSQGDKGYSLKGFTAETGVFVKLGPKI